MSMTTKLCKGVTYHEGVPLIKSHDPRITWSCEIAWQTKIIKYPLLQCLWLPNLAERVYTIRSFLAYAHIILSSRGLVRSRKILDLLYLYYNKPRWWITMRSFHLQRYTTVWTCGHVRPRDKLTTSPLSQYLSPPNLARSLHSMRSLVTWQINYVISPLPQWLWLPNLARWFYTRKSFLR